MICKYKYKGQWYSEDELRNKVGDEFFEREKFEIKEFQNMGIGTNAFAPIRDMSVIDVFKDDMEELEVAQEYIMDQMGQFVYIGWGSQIDKDAKTLLQADEKRLEANSLSITERDYYVPETLDIALNKIYNRIRKIVEEYEKGNQQYIDYFGELRYNTFKKLSNFNNFKKIVNSIYPESRFVLDDQNDIDESVELQSIGIDIKDNIKQDQEKSQSKYIRFLTAFIDYENEKGETRIVDSPRLVYAVMLDAMNGAFNYNGDVLNELQRGFKKSISFDKDLSDYNKQDRKIRAVHDKISRMYSFIVDADRIIRENPILNSMKFEDENTFIFDTDFKYPVHNRYLSNVRNIDSVRPIDRYSSRNSKQSTVAFIENITNEVNKLLKNANQPEITPRHIALLWTYSYNLWTARDLFSLMSSQRDSYPYITSTNGRFGSIKMINRPAGKQSSSYDIRSIILSNLINKFLTKEDVEEYKDTDDYKFIEENLNAKGRSKKSQQLRAINRFVSTSIKMRVPTLREDDPSFGEIVNQINYFLTALDDINLTRDDLESIRSGSQSIMLLEEETSNVISGENIVENNASSLSSLLANLYDSSGEFKRQKVAISADGTAIYPLHNSSYTERIHDFINISSLFNNIDGGLRISNFLPRELQDPSLKFNPIYNGKKQIGKLRLYRGNEYYSFPIMYSREKTRDWFLREFSSGFITEIASRSTDRMRYQWYYPPISNKPNAKSVELSVSGREELISDIQSIIDIIKNRPKELEGLIKNFKTSDTLLLRELEGVNLNHKNAAEKVYEKIISNAIDEAKDFVVRNELHISSEIRAVENMLRSAEKIDEKQDKLLFKLLKKKKLLSKTDLEKGSYTTSPAFSFGVKEKDFETNTSTKKYTAEVKEFIDVYAMFAANNAVATFLVPHLTMGDPAFFKNENDFIKRLSIFFSPGTLPFIDQERISNKGIRSRGFGAKKKRRIAVLKEYKEYRDEEYEETDEKGNVVKKKRPSSIEQTFRYLFEGMPEEELQEIINMFDNDYDRADAQGFMTQAALEDMKAGTGLSFAQGTAVKPVIAGRRVVKIKQEDGTIKEFIVPTAVKYASYVLTDAIREKNEFGKEKFPRAVRLLDWMNANNLQEIVFQSAVKVGSPNEEYLYSLEDVVTMDNPTEFSHLREGDYTMGLTDRVNNTKLSVLEIDTNHIRIQQNPNSDKTFNKRLHTPSQLTYVTNIAAASTKYDNVKSIYNSMSDIMGIQMESIKEELSKDTISSGLFTKAVSKKMAGPGNELFAEYIKRGVDINFPALLQKTTIQFSSYISDDILATKFVGGKFQLVSDVIFNKPYTNRELKIVRKDGQIYAEVLVPRKFRNKFPKNSVFGIDGFTVRIPTSGIHSTLPFKVVGYVDEDSDIFVGPKEITPVQGSDFDADAVFVFRDFTWVDVKNILRKRLKSRVYNQVKETFDKQFGTKKDDFYDLKKPIAEKITEEEIEKKIDSLIKKLAKLELSEDDLQIIRKELTIVLNKQNIISNMKEILMEDSTHNKKEMFSPIYMGLINSKTNSVYEYIADIRNVDINDLLQNLNLSRIQNKNAYYHRNFDGNALTGIFANLFKAVSYMDKAGVGGSRPTIKYENDEDKIKIGDKEYEQLQENTTFNGREITVRMMMDIFINLAIDNVKEQGLPTINATGQTASTYVMGLWLGIPLEDMVGLMLSPMARRISYIKKRSASKDVMKEIETLYGDEDIKDQAAEIEITKDLLKKQIKLNDVELSDMSKEDLLEQYALALLFNRLEKPGRELNEISMYLSVIQNMRVNFKDIEKLKNYFDSKIEYDEEKYDKEGVRKSVILSEIPIDEVKYKSTNFNMPELFKSAPHIYKAIVGQRMLFEYITETLLIYSQSKNYNSLLNNLQRNISQGFSEEDRKDFLRSQILHFFSASTSNISKIRNSNKRLNHPTYKWLMDETDTWQYEFSQRVQKLQQQYEAEGKTNLFLKHVQVRKEAAAGRAFITFSRGRTTDPFEMIKIQNHFKKLPSDIQNDFVDYAILFLGAKHGPANFTLAIPANRFENFSKELKTILNKTVKKADLEKELGVVKDLLEIQVMINSFNKLFHFDAKSVSLNPNTRLELANGSMIYYDMSHSRGALPEGFQPDTQEEKEEKQNKDENTTDVNEMMGQTEDDTEDQKPGKRTKDKDYVSRSVNNNGRWETEIYKRIPLTDDMLKSKDKGRLYYHFVGKVRSSKKYTFDSKLLDTNIAETRPYKMNAAFNPFYPYISIEGFEGKDLEESTLVGEADTFIIPTEGTAVVLHDANDLARQYGKVYRVLGTTVKSITAKFMEYTTKYELLDDKLPPAYDPESLNPPGSEVENTLEEKELESIKDKLEEGNINKKNCKT